MKKRLIAVALVLALALSLCVPAMAANVRTAWTDITYRGISIVINGVEIAPCDEKGNSTEPFIMNDTTYLPVRAIAGALGLNVDWDSATSTVVLESGGRANYGYGEPTASFNVKHVEITYRGTKISLDGENIPLINRNGESVEPFIYNGTNYLPLRVVSEALGLSVGWDGATSTVTLKGSAQPDEPQPDEPKPDEPAPPPAAEMVKAPASMLFKGGKTGGTMEFILDLRYEYDEFGRTSRVYTTGGQVDMKCGYDGRGNLSSLYYKAAGEEITYEWFYNSDNELTAYYENGILISGGYKELDAQGRVVKEEYFNEDNTPVLYEYGYDESGRVIYKYESRPWHSPVTYTYAYDEQGRVSHETFTHEGSNTNHLDYAYAEDGSYVVTHTMDVSEGEVLYLERSQVSTDAEGRRVEEVYDLENDRIRSVSLESYDEAGRLIHKTETLSSTLYSVYVGEVFVEKGNVTEWDYSYDAAGRLICALEEKHGSSMDDQGNVSFKYTGNKEEYWEYDAKGRLISESSKEFSAFVNGDGSEYTTQSGAYDMRYEFDSQGRMVKSTETRYMFGYFGADQPELKISSIVENVYIYDAQGRLVKDYMREVDAEGKGLSYVENYVSFDDQGRIIAQKDSGDGSNIQTWNYQYDSAGNVTYEAYSQNDRGNVQSYEAKYTYDYRGLLAKMVYTDNAGTSITESYVYDNQSRLISYNTFQNGATSVTTMKYNAEGLPISTETKSYADGTTVICAISYVEIPKVDNDDFVEDMVNRIESFF